MQTKYFFCFIIFCNVLVIEKYTRKLQKNLERFLGINFFFNSGAPAEEKEEEKEEEEEGGGG